MKKALLSLVALVAVLTFSAPAKAQYHANEACNQTLSDGFEKYNGSGPNGEIVVRFSVVAHYEAQDMNSVRTALPDALVKVMNYQAQQNGRSTRFLATDFDNPKNLNITVYIDVYHDANGYQAFFYVNGWGVGHLFKFRTDVTAEGGDALVNGAVGTANRMTNGWTCGTQK